MDPMPVAGGGLAGLIAMGIVQGLTLLKARSNGGTLKERLVRLETKMDFILSDLQEMKDSMKRGK